MKSRPGPARWLPGWKASAADPCTFYWFRLRCLRKRRKGEENPYDSSGKHFWRFHGPAARQAAARMGAGGARRGRYRQHPGPQSGRCGRCNRLLAGRTPAVGSIVCRNADRGLRRRDADAARRPGGRSLVGRRAVQHGVPDAVRPAVCRGTAPLRRRRAALLRCAGNLVPRAGCGSRLLALRRLAQGAAAAAGAVFGRGVLVRQTAAPPPACAGGRRRLQLGRHAGLRLDEPGRHPCRRRPGAAG